MSGSCRVGEFRLTGVEAVASETSTHACTPSLTVNGEAQDLEVVTYDSDMTPKLTAVSPRFGTVLGSTTVTLTGENFPADATATVTFDDRVCTVQSQSTTEIVCLTNDKPYVPDSPRMSINFEGFGQMATSDLVYRYVSLWSDTETWGGDIPPLEGESVSIPTGQHLLFDLDSSP